MRVLANILTFVLLILGSSHGINAQEERPITTDTRGWLGISVKKEIINNLDVEVEHSLRWKDNVSELYRRFFQLGAKYKITKWASIRAGYRNAYGAEGYNRYIAALSLKTKLNNWRLKTTSRFEHTNERVEGEADWRRWRQKGTISYKKKKWKLKPYVFSELFFPIEEGSFQARNRIRYGMGADFALTKRQSLTLSAFIQDTSKKNSLQRQRVVSLDYQYEF